MYPLHLEASFRVDDRDLSRAAAEHHLMRQDFRLAQPPTARRSRRAVAAWLRRRPAVEATPATAPLS